MSNRGFMRFISLCVLFCFAGSIGAPYVQAQTSDSAAAAAKVAEGAKTGLGLLWFDWKALMTKAAKPTMDSAGAIQWFRAKGATPAQAEVLALNAASEGHLTTKIPTATSPTAAQTAEFQGNAITRFFNKITGRSPATATVETPVTGTSTSLLSRVKSAFTGASTQGYPTPDSLLKASPVVQDGVTVRASDLKITPEDVAAGITTTAQKAKVMMGMEEAPVAAESKGFLSRFKDGVVNTTKKVTATVKAGAQKVALATKRGASDATGAVRTGVLTAADKVAFWQNYYKIPVTDNIGIKVRGELSYTTKFTDKGWVVDKYATSTSLPGKGESAGALFEVDSYASAAEPAKMGFFQKIASKITGGWNKVKGGITGHKELTADAKTELGKIRVENMLLEKARTLNEVSSSIEQRISNLEQSAKALQRDVPVDEIKALRDTQKYVNEQKKVLERKLTEVHDGKAVTVVKDAAKWALYSVGITAGINIAKQVFSGEKVDFAKAFEFMGQPAFWAGTAGGFAGSMAGAYLGNMLLGGITASLPAGIGLFFRILPGFLGAALGFEFASSFFGRQMDLGGTLVQTLASAGGYTGASLIWTAMMGTAAPGIVLIAASIAAGMLANFLWTKLRGDPESEATILPEQEIVPPAASTTEPAATQTAVPQGAMSLAELQQKRADSYTQYINYLKQRKIPEARTAREEYDKYDQALKAQIQASQN